jgi:hypothetical protein
MDVERPHISEDLSAGAGGLIVQGTTPDLGLDVIRQLVSFPVIL